MKSLLILSILAASLSAHSARWYKKSFVAREGIKIDVSYQLVEYVNYSSRHAAFPIHFEVIGLPSSAKVRVVFINKVKDLSVCGRAEQVLTEVVEKDLLPFGKNHAAYLTDNNNQNNPIVDLERESYCRHQVSIGQEFAIVADGHWLQDPISASSNFKLNFIFFPYRENDFLKYFFKFKYHILY